MNRIYKMTACTLGGAAALFALSLILAKPARALVATLVEVVNTPATPAFTQDVSKTASQIVELQGLVSPGATTAPISVTPAGASGGPFKVPAGQKFVITTVEIVPLSLTTGFTTLSLEQNSGTGRESWQVSNSTSITQLQYPSGIVMAAGAEPQLFIFTGNGNPVGEQVAIHGYLTSN